MPNIAPGITTSIPIAAGVRIRISGVGEYSFIATRTLDLTLDSGTGDGVSMIGPYLRDCVVGLTASVMAKLSFYTESAIPGAPATIQKNQLGEAVSLAFEGQAYNSAVYSVMASGDITGITDTENIRAAQAIVSASSAKKAIIQLNGTNGTFYVRATNITGSKYAAFQWSSDVDLVGVNSPKIVLASSTEPNGYGGHVFYVPGVGAARFSGIEVDGNRAAFISPPAATSLDGQFGSGFYIAGSSDVRVENCWIHSCIYHGVLAVDDCTRVHTRFNRINNCGYRAVHYNANDTSTVTDSSISFNDVYSNGQAADNPTNSGIFMALGSSYRIEAIGNNIRNEKAAGLHIAGFVTGGSNLSREVSAMANIISGGTIGILVTANLQDSNITGNIVSGSSIVGVQLGPMVGCKVNGNTVRRSAGPAVIAGDTGTAALVGCQINDNHFIDCDGSAATNRAAIYFGAGPHANTSCNGNTFLNNGMTTAGATCGGIAMANGANRPKSMSFSFNKFKNNRGHAMVIYNTDDCQIIGNQGMDNFEPGPRGTFVWVRGTAANTLVSGNSALNDNVTNSLSQYILDATTTGTRVVENTGRCATTVFSGAAGATGAAYGNTGSASWPIGVLVGAAAL